MQRWREGGACPRRSAPVHQTWRAHPAGPALAAANLLAEIAGPAVELRDQGADLVEAHREVQPRKDRAERAAVRATVTAPSATTRAAGDASAFEPQESVGTYTTTGKSCPASGWWCCEESHALDGTRWFAQGSLLPAAAFAVHPGVLGKSAGTLRAIQRRGTWQLVRLAQVAGAAGSGSAGNAPVQSGDRGV